MGGSLPFQVQDGHSHRGKITTCPLFKLLPAPLQEESKNHEFLLDYIHMLPVDKVGIPEYYAELNRGLGDLKNPNLIYPVGDDVYIHIFPDESDSRDYYIAIEPGMTQKMDGLMEGLEDRLVDYVDELDDLDGAQTDRGKVLRNILAKACVVVSPKDLRAQRKKNEKKAAARLPVSRAELASLRYQLVRDKEGMGVMEPLILDPYLEDISCSGLGEMYLEHKIFKSLKTNIAFGSMEELDTFVIQLSEKIGKPVTYRNPIVDATLPDGSRINLVFGADVSRRGSNFTIRKFSAEPLSMIQLVEFGGLTYEMAAYFSLAMLHGMNMFIAGRRPREKPP